MNNVQFYSLLFINSDPEKHTNLKLRPEDDPVTVYIRNAHLLSKSVDACGTTLTLLTNDADNLTRRCDTLGISGLNVRTMPFSWPIPAELPYRSAHYKIDVIEQFGTGAFGDRVALIDLDAVMCRIPELPVDRGLCVYDVTDQLLPAFGQPVIDALNAVAGRPLRNPRWYGNEIIAGRSIDFRQLADVVRECWPRYMADPTSFYHTSDETVVAPALNLMSEAGHQLTDLGRTKQIVRWWTVRTLSPFPPFDTIRDRAVLHLPGDKKFLAGESLRPGFSAQDFIRRYRKFAGRRRFGQAAKMIVEAARGKRMYLPRLGVR